MGAIHTGPPFLGIDLLAWVAIGVLFYPFIVYAACSYSWKKFGFKGNWFPIYYVACFFTQMWFVLWGIALFM